MKNYVESGDRLDLAAPRTLTSGSGALIGSIFGVAATDLASGVVGVFMVVGVFDLPKHAGDTPTPGAHVYWDNTNFVVTTTATGNTLIGVATQAQQAGDVTVRVRLNESF